MSSHRSYLSLALVVCATLVPSASGATVFDGEWVGGFRGQTDWVYVRLALGGDGSTAAGRIDLPLTGERGVLLQSVRFDGDHLTFEVPGASGNLVFDGRFDTGRVTGSVRQGWGWSAFELLKVVRPPEIVSRSIVGNYDFGDGRTMLVYYGPQGLAYVDYSTDRMGPLVPVAEDTFISGPSLLAGYPVELTFSAGRDAKGEVVELLVQPKGETARRARKHAFYTTEDVLFPSGDVQIGASLLLPPGPGPFPAVVMIHGSGPSSRSVLMPFADVLARRGIAVLVPDKRGLGRSTGNWVRATFDELASDALAGVQLLKQRPEINARQIGLQGASLGGWVAPLAASRSSDVRFIIVEAAPAISPAEHERQRVEQQMRADGFRRELIDQALVFMDKKFEVGRTGRGWDLLTRHIEKGRRQGWLGYVNPPSSLESLQWHWKHVMSYDPLPALERLTVPVLAVYGELDTITSPGFNRDRMERALRRAGNTDVTIQVFPGANHNFFSAITGGPTEVPRLRGYVPGYFAARVNWLRDRVDEGAPSGGMGPAPQAPAGTSF